MTNQITVVLFDAVAETFMRSDLDRQDVNAFLGLCYACINCDAVDRANVAFAPDRSELTAWIDDMGLYSQPTMSTFGPFHTTLAGNIVFAGGTDENGDSDSVPEYYLANDMANLRALYEGTARLLR